MFIVWRIVLYNICNSNFLVRKVYNPSPTTLDSPPQYSNYYVKLKNILPLLMYHSSIAKNILYITGIQTVVLLLSLHTVITAFLWRATVAQCPCVDPKTVPADLFSNFIGHKIIDMGFNGREQKPPDILGTWARNPCPTPKIAPAPRNHTANSLIRSRLYRYLINLIALFHWVILHLIGHEAF